MPYKGLGLKNIIAMQNKEKNTKSPPTTPRASLLSAMNNFKTTTIARR